VPLLETHTGPIAYDVQGEGEAVVLLCSGAHDRHDWDELRALLPAERLRTIALDWPGHGESPRGVGATSAMRFADVAEQLVEQLAPDGAIVVGNSVGGFAAARLAIRRPELVTGLVIVDGGGFLARSPQVRLFCALMSRPRFLRAIYPAFASRYVRARTVADRRARDASVAMTRQEPGLRAVSELWQSFASPEHDLREQAHAIGAPTLLIWGRRDPVIPLRVGKRIARLINGARLVVFDSGHLPHTSDPQRFAAELERFAAELEHPADAIRGADEQRQARA
jgi:pimeloyl-ACP methyl ester carboxylesterase